MSADYGRVKRALRGLGLEDSLTHLWHYCRLTGDGIPLPHQYQHIDGRGVHIRLEKHVFPHQLDILGRELMLHADRSGKPSVRTLASWNDLARAMNALYYYGEAVFDGEKQGGVMLTLHRIAHQQLPRFSRLSSAKMGRYLALYRFHSLAPFFETQIGIDVDTYFVMAFAVISASAQRPCSNRLTDYSVLGIDPGSAERFFSRVVGTTDEIRKKLIDDQRLGDCWEYTFNALHFKPLVAFDADHPERLICPLPYAVESRLTEGIFFDVATKGAGFEKAYGDGVEYIIGRMLQSLPSTYSVSKPVKQRVGKLEFAGADFIIDQDQSRAYIECKAKRLALRGRVAEKLEDLRSEIQYLANAILQNYRNIDRETSEPDATNDAQCRIFSIVITLEDWLLFSNVATDMLERLVTEGLEKSGLPADLKQRVPYLVFGAETFQHAVAAMTIHPMSDVLGGLGAPQYEGWVPSTYLQTCFPDVKTSSIGGFDKDFNSLVHSLLSDAKMRRNRTL